MPAYLQVLQHKIETDRKALETGAEVPANLSDFVVNYFSACSYALGCRVQLLSAILGFALMQARCPRCAGCLCRGPPLCPHGTAAARVHGPLLASFDRHEWTPSAN